MVQAERRQVPKAEAEQVAVLASTILREQIATIKPSSLLSPSHSGR